MRMVLFVFVILCKPFLLNAFSPVNRDLCRPFLQVIENGGDLPFAILLIRLEANFILCNDRIKVDNFIVAEAQIHKVNPFKPGGQLPKIKEEVCIFSIPVDHHGKMALEIKTCIFLFETRITGMDPVALRLHGNGGNNKKEGEKKAYHDFSFYKFIHQPKYPGNNKNPDCLPYNTGMTCFHRSVPYNPAELFVSSNLRDHSN